MSREDGGPAKSVTYSPWLNFYLCESCGQSDEKAALREPPGPCPDCGSQSLTFLVGRWRIEREQTTFWQDMAISFGLMEFPEQVFIPEFLNADAMLAARKEEAR